MYSNGAASDRLNAEKSTIRRLWIFPERSVFLAQNEREMKLGLITPNGVPSWRTCKMQRTERAKTLRVRRTATYLGLKRLALLALCAVFSDPISAVESKGTV